MRVLVLGATGMLGHRLARDLSRHFDVIGAVRRREVLPALSGLRIAHGLDAAQPETVRALLREQAPAAVLNCVGIVKQIQRETTSAEMIRVNALFPLELHAACAAAGARVIHFSTDCVFSGRGGPYDEHAAPDPDDLYGRSKLLGELTGPGALTLRTSIVGHELRGYHGLLEWLLRQRGGSVRGFAGALYTGLTTNALAEVVRRLLVEHPTLEGIRHVASEPLSKYELLCRIDAVYELGVRIERDDAVACDRRLDGTAFARETGISVPSWDAMLADMHAAQRSAS